MMPGLTSCDLLNPSMNPMRVMREFQRHAAHLLSIPPAAAARLLLIGWEIDMLDIRSGHYRFFKILTVWTANEKERWGETAIFNERGESNNR